MSTSLTKAAKKLDDHEQRSEVFDRSETLLADAERSTIEQYRHLRALTLAPLIGGDHTVVRAGLPEFVTVIDVDQPNGNGEATIDWGIDVEVPARVVAELLDARAATSTSVVARHGVITHAPGEMNLGRSARHANRSQRRALRGLSRGCAVPGCGTHFDRC